MWERFSQSQATLIIFTGQSYGAIVISPLLTITRNKNVKMKRQNRLCWTVKRNCSPYSRRQLCFPGTLNMNTTNF